MRRRLGFTLTELLIVIVIIGILASLALVGVMAARRAVVTGTVRAQLSQMEMALEKYKADFGEYPPNLTDVEACVRHAQMRWPRASITYWDIFAAALAPCYDCWAAKVAADVDTKVCGYATCVRSLCPSGYTPMALEFDPQEPFANRPPPLYLLDELNTRTKWIGKNPDVYAVWCRSALIERSLSFWLGGVFDYRTGKMTGFSADKENPFTSTIAQREEPRFDFQEGKNMQLMRITEIFWNLSQMPPSGYVVTVTVPVFMIRQQPVAYFRARIQAEGWAYPQKMVIVGNDYYVPIGSDLGQAALIKRDTSTWSVEREDDFGLAVPYAKEGTVHGLAGAPTNLRRANWQNSGIQWYNDDKYQLIYPGMDGKFSGSDRQSITRQTNTMPRLLACVLGLFANTANSGTGLSSFDLDNVVNFGSTGTLDGEVEQ